MTDGGGGDGEPAHSKQLRTPDSPVVTSSADVSVTGDSDAGVRSPDSRVTSHTSDGGRGQLTPDLNKIADVSQYLQVRAPRACSRRSIPASVCSMFI